MSHCNDRRVFMGWHRPALVSAVAWLEREYTAENDFDLSDLLVVLPGGRAGRRFLELLVEQAGHRVLVPPEIVTAGSLPERLYEPHRPIASDLLCLLVRAATLRQADPDLIAVITSKPPAKVDLTAWTDLARQIDQLDADLSADAVRFEEVLGQEGSAAVETDDRRWEALTLLQNEYESSLSAQGLCDLHRARFEAIDQLRCVTGRKILLLATADLNRVTRKMLEQVAADATPLIYAPPEEAETFDAMGTLIVNRWVDRGLEVDDACLHVVERHRDQAREVGHLIAAAAREHQLVADQITIGAADESLNASIERMLTRSGVSARPAAGRLVGRSRPGTLLDVLARFLQTQAFRDWATLLRHPDLEAALEAPPTDQNSQTRGTTPLLAMLDQYASNYLPGQLPQDRRGRDAFKLQTVRDKLNHLTALLGNDRRPLGDWSQPIMETLAAVYGVRPLDRRDEEDATIIRALESITDVLRQLAALEPDSTFVPDTTAAEAIQFVLVQLAGTAIPPEAASPATPPEFARPPGPADDPDRNKATTTPESAIELLGWLELHLDDAPCLFVAGVNEGLIPESVSYDIFLTDQLRAVLGIRDNRARLARDKYFLKSILRSRPQVTLVAARRGRDDQPLMPSRLVLACDALTMARRIDRFYTGTESAKTPVAGRPSEDKSTRRSPDEVIVEPHLFRPPLPALNDPAINELLQHLPVTAFGDYLRCRYRFFLKYILRLEPLDDQAVELDAAAFGSLLHDTLKVFGQSDQADSTDPQEIHEVLTTALDRQAAARFDRARLPAVALQLELARVRLESFARWQARTASDGWRILTNRIETVLSAPLEPGVVIKGRIDRLDRHRDGSLRVIDYKTGDTGKSPEDVHRRRNGETREWINLQLPLYRFLLEKNGVISPSDDVQLGYVLLPKQDEKTGFEQAMWDRQDMEEALNRAQELVQQIRSQVFWPPSPPDHRDEFSSLCMEGTFEGQAALKTATR